MVKVKFERDNWCIYSFKAEDHAGNDIVCSAISALSMALVGMLKFYGVEFLKCEYGSGIVEVEIAPFAEEEGRRATDIMFQTIYTGLKQIEKKYPDRLIVAENTPIF